MRRTIAGAVLLVAMAGSASAECAWVLWTVKGTYVSPSEYSESDWTTVAGYASSRECWDAKTREEAWNKAVHPSKGGRGHWMYLYRCLPDSIDPRGAKGAPRSG